MRPESSSKASMCAGKNRFHELTGVLTLRIPPPSVCHPQIAKLRRQLCELRPVPPLDLPGPMEPSQPVVRLEEIMASEGSPPLSPKRPQMRRKRSSFMLSPEAFLPLEDSSPSPEEG